MPAILFGSISTVADTSELQRDAFNRAFAEHGLDWEWDQEAYVAMLDTSGGRDRIAEYARSRGQDVDAAAIHRTKSRVFQEALGTAAPEPRPGVVESIQEARSRGYKVGLVTTTSPDNVAALLGALAPTVTTADFDVIVDSTDVTTPKPDGAAYEYALSTLGDSGENSVAIEDNVDGVRAANAAGLQCVAFPNANTAGHDFAAARRRVERVDLDELLPLLDTPRA